MRRRGIGHLHVLNQSASAASPGSMQQFAAQRRGHTSGSGTTPKRMPFHRPPILHRLRGTMEPPDPMFQRLRRTMELPEPIFHRLRRRAPSMGATWRSRLTYSMNRGRDPALAPRGPVHSWGSRRRGPVHSWSGSRGRPAGGQRVEAGVGERVQLHPRVCGQGPRVRGSVCG